MALTRSMLKGMGLTEEQVGAIIDAHTETVDGLKKERDKFKDEVEKIPALQKEIEELKESNDSEDWKTKYEEEHENFEKFKSEVSGEKTIAQIKEAFKKVLADCKVGDKFVDSIIRVTDFSKMKLDKDGKLVDEAKIAESVKSDYSGFIEAKETKGTSVETPPANNGSGKTKDEILAIKDTQERQAAIAENHELFGF